MTILYAILTFKFAFVMFTFLSPVLGTILLTKIYYLTLTQTPNNIQYKSFFAFIELNYILIYITHTYILYLWLFAIGDDRNLLKRFKIIYGCSIFVYICSILYRWAIFIFPTTLLNPWILVFCILIFGINALFRVSLRVGILANYLVKLALLQNTPKKSKIQLKAESFNNQLKFSFFIFGHHSIGQILLLKNAGHFPIFEESFMVLDQKTMFIDHKYTYLSVYCICISGLILFIIS